VSQDAYAKDHRPQGSGEDGSGRHKLGKMGWGVRETEALMGRGRQKS